MTAGPCTSHASTMRMSTVAGPAMNERGNQATREKSEAEVWHSIRRDHSSWPGTLGRVCGPHRAQQMEPKLFNGAEVSSSRDTTLRFWIFEASESSVLAQSFFAMLYAIRLSELVGLSSWPPRTWCDPCSFKLSSGRWGSFNRQRQSRVERLDRPERFSDLLGSGPEEVQSFLARERVV